MAVCVTARAFGVITNGADHRKPDLTSMRVPRQVEVDSAFRGLIVQFGRMGEQNFEGVTGD